jgi:hypothetical protein
MLAAIIGNFRTTRSDQRPPAADPLLKLGEENSPLESRCSDRSVGTRHLRGEHRRRQILRRSNYIKPRPRKKGGASSMTG